MRPAECGWKGNWLAISFRVLLVNAATPTQRLCAAAAKVLGAELVAEESAERAAHRIHAERFEAIFIDTADPGVSRQGLTHLIRMSRLNSQAPVLLLTDYQGKGTVAGETPEGAVLLVRPASGMDLEPLRKELRKRIRAERRRHRRLSVRTTVSCSAGLRRFRATSFDLSATGMLIDVNVPFELGEEWEVQFLLAPDEPAFRGRVRVARTAGPNRVAVTFQKLGGLERQRLRQFLDQHLLPRR